MDRVRVVHVITRFDKGGSAENTFLTLRGLDGRRYEGFLACGSPGRYPISPAEERAVEENLAALAALGVEVITLPHLVREIRPLSDLRAFVSLLGLFRRLRPVIVHTHTSKAGILGRWAAWLCRVPVIVHTPTATSSGDTSGRPRPVCSSSSSVSRPSSPIGSSP